MKLLTLLVALAALAGAASGALTPAGTAQAPADFDLLITNGRIVNGTGNPWFRADIGIRGDTIAEIGDLGDRTAVRTIDVRGQVVAPGFIDMHTHVDDAFDSDDANAILNYLLQGVTTVRTGSDGSGSFRVAETKARWESGGIGANAVMMVPFNVIRREVMGRDNLRPASPDEIERMRAIVRQRMSEGAWGVSTGLEYDGLNVYASTEEVIEVTEPVAEFGGVYISHMRDEAGSILEAADEIIRISEGAGVPVQITHLKAAGRDNWGEMRRVVDMVNEARARGVRITADQYPFLQGAPIDFITDLIDIPDDLESLTELRRLMRRSEFNTGVSQSDRNAARREFVVALQQALGDEATRARLRESTYEPRRADPSAVARWGWQDFRIKVTDRHPELLERTLDELVDEQGRDGFDIVADLILDEPDMLFASASQSPDDMRHAMSQDWVMISSDGGGFAPVPDDARPVRAHPRSFASQSVALRRYVREEGLLTLADAVRKMTSLPAQFLGMKDRGLLLEGFKADVVIFDPDTISDHATYADAHRYATGVEAVVVNGVISIENGSHTGALAGKVLLKSAPPSRPPDQQALGDREAFSTNILEAQLASDIRNMENELAFMSGKANSVRKNARGYWEADFDHGITMIYVPAGTFVMGNDQLHAGVSGSAAAPAHEVSLAGYWIAKTQTTKGQFRAFVEETKYVTSVEQPGHEGPWVYNFDDHGFTTIPGHSWRNAFHQVSEKFPEIQVDDSHPVANVSWNDAAAFCDWLAKTTGVNFVLPTEAEWEYAARGDDQRIYPWGNEAPDGSRANYADDTFDRYFPGTEQARVHHGVNDGYAATSPVGAFPAGASPVGALDMAGNVSEWVFDRRGDYEDKAYLNPMGPADGADRVMKAGFWAGSAGRPGQPVDELEIGHNIRSDARQHDDPDSADDHLGFRIAIDYLIRR